MQINDVYKHFKGGEYHILGISYCAEGDHLVPRVEYMDDKGMRFSRSIHNFLEIVDRPDHNYKGPRFVFLRKG